MLALQAWANARLTLLLFSPKIHYYKSFLCWAGVKHAFYSSRGRPILMSSRPSCSTNYVPGQTAILKSVTNKQTNRNPKNKKRPNNKCFLLFLQRRKFSSLLDSLNTFHLLYMLMCVHSPKIQKRVLVVCFVFVLVFIVRFLTRWGGGACHSGVWEYNSAGSTHEALAPIPITK